MTTKPPKFTSLNPYKDCDDPIRFVSNVSKKIYNFFYAIHPTTGLQQTTINIFFDRLHKRCLELGIVPGAENSESRLEQLIQCCNFELPRSTGESVVGVTDGRNDGGTTQSGSAGNKATTPGRPELPSELGVGKQRTRSKRAVKGQNKQSA